MKNFLIKFLASLLIGSFFFIWILRNVDLQEIAQMKIHYTFIALGIGFYIAALCIRAIRWQKLLFPFISLTFFQVFKALVVGYAMNVILPARLGELFRVNICKKWYSLSRSTALATIVWERVADGITVVTCLTVGALSLSNFSNEITGLIVAGISLFSSAIFILFLLRNISLEFFLQKMSKLRSRIVHFQRGIQEVSTQALIQTMTISLLVWTFDGLSLWAIVRGTGVSLGFFQTTLLIGVVSLSTLLPSPPGFLGTMQFAFGIALIAAGHSVAFGVLAASLTQIFLLGSLTVTGLILLGWVSLKKPKMDLQT